MIEYFSVINYQFNSYTKGKNFGTVSGLRNVFVAPRIIQLPSKCCSQIKYRTIV